MQKVTTHERVPFTVANIALVLMFPKNREPQHSLGDTWISCYNSGWSCRLSMVNGIFGRYSPLSRRRASPKATFLSRGLWRSWIKRCLVPIHHVHSSLWGGGHVLLSVYVTLNCHNRKHNDFRYIGAHSYWHVVVQMCILPESWHKQ